MRAVTSRRAGFIVLEGAGGIDPRPAATRSPASARVDLDPVCFLVADQPECGLLDAGLHPREGNAVLLERAAHGDGPSPRQLQALLLALALALDLRHDREQTLLGLGFLGQAFELGGRRA